MKIIFHIDMDAFFAACEEKRNPGLKNKPVIIGSDPKSGRGVVSTANYKAREFGIGSAMPISKAYQLCPEGEYIRPDMRLYVEESRSVMEVFSSFADSFEQVSIDEAYLDVTSNINSEISPKIHAAKIKKEVFNKTKLTCSIGIAWNKSVAKIASDLEKPNGLTQIKKINEIYDLPARKISGIGKQTNKLLESINIKTIGDIANSSQEFLQRKLGKHGIYIWQISKGYGSSNVEPREGHESYSNERTFKQDIDDIEQIHEVIKKLSQYISDDLKEDKYFSRTVSIKLRYDDFETITRAQTLSFGFNDYNTIKDTAKNLFDTNYDADRLVRLIGVKCSNLIEIKEKQTRLTEWF